MIKIRIKEKGGGEQVLTFDRDTVNIGRARGNDIVLPRPNISKRHARIMVMEGEMYVIDLKSTNGTYVNGDRISAPVKVSDQDKIFMGDFMLKVEKFLEEEAIIPDERVSSSEEYYEPPAPPAEEIERSAHDAIKFMDDELPSVPPPPPAEDEPEALDVAGFDEAPASPAVGTDAEVPAAVDLGLEAELPDEDFLKASASAQPATGPSVEASAEGLDALAADELLFEPAGEPEVVLAPPPAADVPDEGLATGMLDADMAAELLKQMASHTPPSAASAPQPPAGERHATPAFLDALPEAEPRFEPELESLPGPDLSDGVSDVASATSEAPAEAEPEPLPVAAVATSAASPTSVQRAIQREMDHEIEQIELDANEGRKLTVGEMPRLMEHPAPDRSLEHRVSELLARLSDEGLLTPAGVPAEHIEAVREAVRLELGEDLEAADLEVLVHDLVGLGALDTFLSGGVDGDVLHALGAGVVTVTNRGRATDFHEAFASNASFRFVLQRLTRRLGASRADGDVVQRGTLPGGETVSVFLPGFTGDRPVLRVERRRPEFRPIHAWVESGLLDDVMAEFLGGVVLKGDGLLVLGPEATYRDGLLEALSLFMVGEAPVVVAQDHGLVRPRHAQVLPLARSWAEREWPSAVAEIRRLAPRHLVLPALGAGEVVRWLPLLVECEGKALASAAATGLDAWLERVALRWALDGAHPDGVALRAACRQAFRYVVTLHAWPCGTRKVLAIDELVRDASGLAVKPCFQYKEDRKSPDGRVVGHFEKTVG